MAVQLSQQREKMSQQPEEKQLEGQREEEIPSNQIPGISCYLHRTAKVTVKSLI